MEQSKQSNRTIELGKKIVHELQLEHSSDTLGRWMAHHIAELIKLTELGTPAEQAERQKQCRAAILELWEHVHSLPPASRPFRDLGSIVETIRALNPNEHAYFYQPRAQELADNPELPKAAKDWLKLSRGIDCSARLLIRMCLDRVMAETSGEFREWMKLAADADAHELPIVRVVYEIEGQSEDSSDAAEEQKKELQKRLDSLKGMVQLSEKLAHDIRSQINKLETS